MRNKSAWMMLSEQQQAWQSLPLSTRMEVLQHFRGALQGDPRWGALLQTTGADLHSSSTIHALCQAQLRQAEHLLAGERVLPGVTGESNVLYCVGKGITLVVATEQTSLAALLVAIQGVLLAGNSAILWLAPRWSSLTQLFGHYWPETGNSRGVLTWLAAAGRCDDILRQPLVEAALFLGDEPDARRFNQQLAHRQASVISPVLETDAVNLSTVRHPDFLRRLVSERVRTINLTATGGNASLMELG